MTYRSSPARTLRAIRKRIEQLEKAKQEENSVATKAQLEQKTRELRDNRELEELGQQIDFKKLTDDELIELLGIRNGKAGKPATPKRTLEILRGAKARIDKGAPDNEHLLSSAFVAEQKPGRGH